MKLLHLFGLVAAAVTAVSAACDGPDKESGLTDFSTTTQFTNNEKDIVITTAIRLDVDLDVDTITVNGSVAKLVFKDTDLTIKTKMILVTNHGQLIIGSEACRFVHTVHIVLKGTRDRTNLLHAEAGEKFVAVTDNGVLHIHGEQKLPWTKLSKTVNRFADVNTTNSGADVIYHHKNSIHSNVETWTQGLTLHIVNTTFHVNKYETYDFKRTTAASEQSQVDSMVSELDAVSTGDLVVICLQNYFEPNSETNFTALWTKIENKAGITPGNLLMRTAYKNDAFSLVFVNGGSNYNQKLDKQIGKASTKATASIKYQEKKVSGESWITVGKTTKSCIDMRILSLSVGYPTIDVVSDISSWRIGDRILLTSTDYAYNHGEVRQIKAINGKTITLNGELFYRHFGEVVQGVDMRAAVALLSRNIKISGDMSRDCTKVNGICSNKDHDTHGGHMKFIGNFGDVFVEGAELWHMGMSTDIGNYPFHFHMCGNVTGKLAILKENSVHDTFMRAITVHGCFGATEQDLGVKVLGNVAFNILGHAFFTEDGSEIATQFHGNLGAQVSNVKADFTFATDTSKASIFWITNPKVIMTDNYASGAQGMCIWYTFPLEPLDPSKTAFAGAEFNMYQLKEAKYTPMWKFADNTVSSCLRGGMNFDNILEENGSVRGCMNYEPLENPKNKTSKPVKIQIIRLNAFKNINFNVWIRGGWFELMQLGCGDSTRCVQLARASKQQSTVTKSIILGRTPNAEPEGYPDAPTKAQLPHIIGVMWYDGPSFVQSTYFNHFKPDASGAWTAGALGFKPENLFSSAVTSTSTDIRYGFIDKAGGNRVFNDPSAKDDSNLSTFDGSESATFRDGDGSVTQCTSSDPVPAQLVIPKQVLLTENCTFRENWNMCICPDLYGKVKVSTLDSGVTGDFDNSAQMKRTKFTEQTDKAYEDHTAERSAPEFMVILGAEEYFYDMQFNNSFPKKFRLEAKGVEKNKPIIAGICLPDGAEFGTDFKLFSWTPDDVFWGNDEFKFVNSFDELKEDTSMRRVYYHNRMLYIKFQNRNTRNPAWDAHDTDHCPGKACPTFTVEMLQTNLAYTRCFDATEEELKGAVDVSALKQHDCDLAINNPDADWGPGDRYAKIHDGNWGPYTGWSYCCYKDGETNQTTTRKRFCDNPPPSSGGATCAGPSTETKACDVKCPVNGELSIWSTWSDCGCDGNSYGSRTRTRNCNVANGGTMCQGSLKDTKACNGGCV